MGNFFNPAALKIVMERRRKTVIEFAHCFGVRPPLIRGWLLGTEEPSKEQIKRMAVFFNWPIGFFYNEELRWETERWVSGYIIQTPIITS